MLLLSQQGGRNMKNFKKAIVVTFLLILTFSLNLNKRNQEVADNLDDHIIDILYLA